MGDSILDSPPIRGSSRNLQNQEPNLNHVLSRSSSSSSSIYDEEEDDITLTTTSPIHDSTADRGKSLASDISYTLTSSPPSSPPHSVPSSLTSRYSSSPPPITLSIAMNQVNYQDNANAIAQERNSLKALRRISFDASAAADPDLPYPSSPPRTLLSSSKESSLIDQTSEMTLDNIWVPAHIHSAVGPEDWHSFIHERPTDVPNRVDDPDTSLNISTPPRLSLIGNQRVEVTRKRSKLSRVINTDSDTLSGFEDGADRLQSKAEKRMSNGVAVPDLELLQKLELESRSNAQPTVSARSINGIRATMGYVISPLRGRGLRRTLNTSHIQSKEQASKFFRNMMPTNNTSNEASLDQDSDSQSIEESTSSLPFSSSVSVSLPDVQVTDGRLEFAEGNFGYLDPKFEEDKTVDNISSTQQADNLISSSLNHIQADCTSSESDIFESQGIQTRNEYESQPFNTYEKLDELDDTLVSPTFERSTSIDSQIEISPISSGSKLRRKTKAIAISAVGIGKLFSSDREKVSPTKAEDESNGGKGAKFAAMQKKIITGFSTGQSRINQEIERVTAGRAKSDSISSGDSCSESTTASTSLELPRADISDVIADEENSKSKETKLGSLFGRAGIGKGIRSGISRTTLIKTDIEQRLQSSYSSSKRSGQEINQKHSENFCQDNSSSPTSPSEITSERAVEHENAQDEELEFGWNKEPIEQGNAEYLDMYEPRKYYYARYPIHVERAIYRLSHFKLANPRRPLWQQVVLSNFMYSYLELINQGESMYVPTNQREGGSDFELQQAYYEQPQQFNYYGSESYDGYGINDLDARQQQGQMQLQQQNDSTRLVARGGTQNTVYIQRWTPPTNSEQNGDYFADESDFVEDDYYDASEDLSSQGIDGFENYSVNDRPSTIKSRRSNILPGSHRETPDRREREVLSDQDLQRLPQQQLQQQRKLQMSNRQISSEEKHWFPRQRQLRQPSPRHSLSKESQRSMVSSPGIINPRTVSMQSPGDAMKRPLMSRARQPAPSRAISRGESSSSGTFVRRSNPQNRPSSPALGQRHGRHQRTQKVGGIAVAKIHPG
ncbi:uncharacterized protein V1516DRAFT_664749 [Lipomyces oligophaga]|uniref:uncharacterized protein n=1 Tax=Lipomyces oligophaga TaxID=45792 RepID=UPI0034CF3F5D